MTFFTLLSLQCHVHSTHCSILCLTDLLAVQHSKLPADEHEADYVYDKEPDRFYFSLESSGALPASQICMAALDQMYNKLLLIEQSLSSKIDDIHRIKDAGQ
eukprot:m.95957 g.95957  ORF g.95957 m.95957 type:complete len:102 (-) comp15035_c0_seq12:947-1252(-)